MTSNDLLLHFAPSQDTSSQNSNVDSYLQYCEVDSLKPGKSELSLYNIMWHGDMGYVQLFLQENYQ